MFQKNQIFFGLFYLISDLCILQRPCQNKNKAISSRHYLIKQTHIMNRVLFLYVHYILTIHLTYDTDLKIKIRLKTP